MVSENSSKKPKSLSKSSRKCSNSIQLQTISHKKRYLTSHDSPTKRVKSYNTVDTSPNATKEILDSYATDLSPTSLDPTNTSPATSSSFNLLPQPVIDLAKLPPEYAAYAAQLQQQMVALAALSTVFTNSNAPCSSVTMPSKHNISPSSSNSLTTDHHSSSTMSSPELGGNDVKTMIPQSINSPSTRLPYSGYTNPVPSITQTISTLAPHAYDEEENDSCHGSNGRKNYKSLTRERRVEANARERTRVHTISAAFETLRCNVPSYSSTQRLSKLAILRIACRYIESLASLLDMDYSRDQNAASFPVCVGRLHNTIWLESKLRRS